jgi:hypothetical protein
MRRPRLAACAAALGLAAATAAAAPASAPAALTERPLVYVVVIDGLDGDRVDAGRAPFLSSLLAGQGARATYWRESRALMLSETNPNHTAMATGAYGDTSGIPGNAFALYSPLETEDTCVPTGPESQSTLPSETSGESATCLKAQTMFESILRQGDPDQLATAAVFGKPKLGRIFAGRNADPARRDVDHLWAPCSEGPDDDEYCAPVPTNPVSGYAIDDAAVMDEVLRTVDEGIEADGRFKRPDLTFVNLHQVDSAGHGFGTASGAYDQAIAMADDQLQRLVERLRARVEWERTIMIVLSDHSMDTTLTKLTMTSRFEDAGIPEGSFLAVDNGGSDAIYLADRTAAGRHELLKRMREVALATPGVFEALYREPNPADGGDEHTVDRVHPGWHAAGERSPDLLLTAEPGVAFSESSSSSNPLPGNHGGPNTRDNFFAVVSGGDAVRQQTLDAPADARYDDTLQNELQAENVDVAATAMGLLGLAAPRDNEGRFLFEAFDVDAVAGHARPTVPRLGLRVASTAGRGCRYEARWRPAGGVYDVQIRSGRRWGGVRRRLTRSALRFRGAAGRRYTVRVRSRAASGVHTRWTTRRASGRACR